MIPVSGHFKRVDLDHIEQVTRLFGYFDIWSKDRSEQDDLIAFIQQEVLLQGVEDITHRSCPAFCCKKVELTFGRMAIAKCQLQIVFYQHFRIFQNTVRNRVLVTNHPFGPFMYEVVFIDTLFTDHIFVSIS